MITDFELLTKFKPFYKAGKSICITSDNFIIADDGENVNYINCENHQLVKCLNKSNEIVTCFVSNPNDYTVIMANKDLHLRKINRMYPDKHCKKWNSCHSAPIFAMSLNATSTRLATGGADNKVRIWHIGENEGNSYSCIYHKSKINILRNHPSRSMVVSVSMLDHDIAAWNTDNGAQLGIFNGHQQMVTAVDFHAASNAMITASRDQTVIVWDCETFARRKLIPMCESIEACIVWRDSPTMATDGGEWRFMAGGERGIMAMFNAVTGARLQEYTKASLFSNSGQTSATSDSGDLRAIRAIVPTVENGGVAVCRESDSVEFYGATMALRHELVGEMSALRDVVVVGERGDMLLAVESAPYMRLYDCSAMISPAEDEDDDISKCTQWPSQVVAGGHSAEILSVSVCLGGCLIVTGAKDGRVCVWRLDNNDARLRMKLVTFLDCPGAIVSCVCASEDGTRIYANYSLTETLAVLSFVDDCLIKVCDIAKPHSGIVACMDINADSSLLATGSKDKLAKIWSYQKKKNQLTSTGTLRGHGRGVWSVKFSAKERVLLTSSMDKSIKLWSLDSFECIVTMKADSVIYKALFTQDEKQIISCGEDGFVSVWTVDKKAVSHTVKVHEQSVQSMNFLYNKKGKFTGFVVAGESSMIGLYKDVSKKEIEESKKCREQKVQDQQELDNLLAQEKLTEALKLAIKLNKPMKAYEILDEIHKSQINMATQLSPLQIFQQLEVADACRTLSGAELNTLLQFAIKWILNAKTSVVAREVFVFINCTIPNSELSMNRDISKHLQQIKSHEYKNYRRSKAASEALGLFNYFHESTVVRQLEEFKMDTD